MMGAQVTLLPAVGMPKHLAYCPRSLLIPGGIFAVFCAFVVSLFYEYGFLISIFIFYGIWHGFWAFQYSRDPWIVSTLLLRFDLGLIPGFYNNMLIKQKAWVYVA